jgi:hypothetical protein
VVSNINQNQVPLTVGILIFDQVEVLDVAGPFEVFSVTRLNDEHGKNRHYSECSWFQKRWTRSWLLAAYA